MTLFEMPKRSYFTDTSASKFCLRIPFFITLTSAPVSTSAVPIPDANLSFLISITGALLILHFPKFILAFRFGLLTAIVGSTLGHTEPCSRFLVSSVCFRRRLILIVLVFRFVFVVSIEVSGYFLVVGFVCRR